jgi:putative PIN family toxin of toxin-antitoxin system
MKIVCDTNVLVSGLLSPFGPSAKIVRLIASADVTVLVDARLVSEYREVLLRPKFGFSSDAVEALLDQIMASGDSVSAGPIHRPLPDPDDEPFLEVAISGMADALVTGNQRHYPKPARAGIRVLSPREFLEYYKTKDG